MQWNDGDLIININEYCAPLPQKLFGQVRLTPGTCYAQPMALDASGRHYWQAVAPHARIVAQFENPSMNWTGNAYHDMNWGEEPLERGFKRWNWLRSSTNRGTRVLYDIEARSGAETTFGYCFQEGQISETQVPPRHTLRRGIWGMTRDVRSETQPKLIATLEDAPFYTRNHLQITLDGEPCTAVHESLSLDRFSHPITQWMLPFRMPRRN